MSGAHAVVLRVSYARLGELGDDVARQMVRGGLLIKIGDTADLTLDTPVELELVLPDGARLHRREQVLQVLAGFGVAVSVHPELVEQARRAAAGSDAGADDPAAGPARHERLAPSGGTAGPEAAAASAPAAPMKPPPAAPPAARDDGPSRSEKIQQALHGTRDERNAILRDRDRTLHPFVLKNPQLNADDVIAIAKNAQMTPDLLKQIGERKDWFQRPAIAVALARNPRTPPDLAVRALEHVPLDALRLMAKGTGVLPHVTQAARKKLLGGP